ncbi:MAG: lysylphosphatidylglycerol synthase transmembrane domain-containing protein, partial [Candidatus Aureabacteria bacterium]|nr:lysylphosphatidylglycerol synthase transmembrane domain-containing protein [Candidatus Auribacterota bacterium]
MRTKVRNWLLSLLKVGLAAGIIIYIFKTRVDLRELLSQVRAMDRGGLIFCWCAYGALFLLSARRWQILARVQGIAARYAELIEYCFIGLFFNNILLGSMGGDVLKAYYLARAVPARREGAVISVVADRSVGFLSFFVIGLVGLLLNRGDARLRGPIAIFFAFFACALLFLL